jgi:predicted fused transcriptional regulator/phosphomethylpyrimidine kinase
MKPIYVEVGAGELIDKITILEIKCENIKSEAKLKNIRYELEVLAKVRDDNLAVSDQYLSHYKALKSVNAELWVIEDDIRICERNADFGAEFVRLARAVYVTNDKRAEIKRALNLMFESAVVEEKSYEQF